MCRGSAIFQVRTTLSRHYRVAPEEQSIPALEIQGGLLLDKAFAKDIYPVDEVRPSKN